MRRGLGRWASAARGSDDRGAGTVLVVGLVATGLVLLLAVSLLVGAQRSRGAAQTAADLAALAAATRLLHSASGMSDACPVAEAVAARNGVRLTGCSVEDGGAVRVGTAVDTRLGSATAWARAGPATSREPGP